MARTIQSPGVEIKEIDLSLRANLPIGTYVMVPGFSDKGPTDEVVQVTSQSEFENIYGLPTTPAERYFYHSVRPLFNSPANILTYRLPYGEGKGNGFGNTYGVLAYPSKSTSISQVGVGQTALNSVSISLNYNTNALTVNGLSGANFLLQGSSSKTYSFAFGFGGAGPVRLPVATGASLSATLTQGSAVTTANILSSVKTAFGSLTGAGKEFANITIAGDVLTFNLSATDAIVLGTNAAVVQSLQEGLDQDGDVYSAEQALGTTPAGASNFGDTLNTFDEQGNDVLTILGKPTHFQLTQEEYNSIQTGTSFSWSNSSTETFTNGFDDLGKAAMLILNKGQTTIDQRFQGFYIGAIDNTNLNDATDFDGILTAETVAQSAAFTSNYTTLPGQRLDFSLSSISDNNTSTFGQDTDSISEIMENLNDFDISTDLFDDTISLGIFRLRQSPFTTDTIKLGFTLAEGYVGTFDYHRQIQSQDGGAPIKFSIETREDQSPNVQVMVNDYLSHKNGDTYLNIDGVPTNKIRFASSKMDSTVTADLSDRTAYFTNLSASYGAQDAAQAQTLSGVVESFVTFDVRPADSLYPLGTYANSNARTKDIGSIPQKLDRLFDSVENPDIYELDLTVDAGLTTINAVSEYLERGGKGKYFDDTVSVSAIDGFYTSNILNISQEAIDFRSDWKTVFDRFAQFAEFRRKDHLFIADLPRHIFVQGTNFKTLDDDTKNFSLNISSPLRAFTAVTNTSYATTYANWAQVYDTGLDDQTWAPFSGSIAATMVNTDSNFQPWYAPAGFTRGVVTGVNDLALYPKQKQRDQLYKNSINPIAFFPNEGYVIFGQKTLLKKPSAFDRINVRRLFLYLEKATARTVKYFVFDPNTLLTRTRVLNTIQPIFENCKNTEGVYDYLLVCDERNNTPDVIDQNEMVIDIYLKPVRAAEFILVNFYATRTGANFNELV
tara:strand:+ start:1107 stop:3953 length:2847 start_codon:yes stop_codon:yes gene_type:complete